MVSFHWRETTRNIDNNDWNYNDNLDSLFKLDQWAKVFDVDNVIDILIISWSGNFYSISPKTFAERMPRDDETNKKFYVPPNNGKAVKDYPRNGSEGDVEAPLGGPSQKGEEMVRFINDDEWAAWNGDKDSNKYRPFLNTTGEFNQEQNRWSAAYEEIKFQETLDNKKQRDAATYEQISDGWWRYNQLSRLINFITAYQEAVKRGYKFFNPDLQNRINYIKKVWSNQNHMLVMYLDAKSAALGWGCFNPDRENSISDAFLTKIFQSDKLNNRDAMLNMGISHCTKPMPLYSVWGRGRYGMGADLYSPNTKYRAVLQPDGNFVVYNINKGNPILEQDAVWASNTYLKRYRINSRNKDYDVALVKPTLVVQDDGNVVIYSRDDVAVWAIGTNGDIRLGLDNDGVLFAFRDNDPNNTVWSSIGGNNHKSGAWSSLANALISKSCKQGDPRNPMSGFDISKQIVDICKTDNNLVNNDALCGFLQKKKLDPRMDNATNDIKRDVDNFVKNVLCAADKLVNADDKTKKFCSCFVPYSDVQKKLVQNGIATNCTDTCMMDGYRSADQPEACDSKICIMDQSIKNLLNGEYISQQCNISNSSPSTSTNTSATPTSPSAPALPTLPATPTLPDTSNSSNNTNNTNNTNDSAKENKIQMTTTQTTMKDTSKHTTSPPDNVEADKKSTEKTGNQSDAANATSSQNTQTIIIFVGIIIIAYLFIKYASSHPRINPSNMYNQFPQQRYMYPMQQQPMTPQQLPTYGPSPM